MVTAAQTAATLAVTLTVRHLSKLKRAHSEHDGAICRGGIQALRCGAKGGSAGRKEKVMTHQTSQNPPPSPLLVYGKWNAVFFPPPVSDVHLLDKLQGQALG